MNNQASFPTAASILSYWLPPLLWCAGVLVLSGDWGSSRHTLTLVQWLLSWFPLTPGQVLVVNGYVRKTGHVTAYGALYFLWFRAFRGSLACSALKSFLWALGLSLLLALLDEGHQSLYQTRSGSLWDVGLDCSAALLAAALTALWWRPRTGKQPAADQLAPG